MHFLITKCEMVDGDEVLRCVVDEAFPSKIHAWQGVLDMVMVEPEWGLDSAAGYLWSRTPDGAVYRYYVHPQDEPAAADFLPRGDAARMQAGSRTTVES